MPNKSFIKPSRFVFRESPDSSYFPAITSRMEKAKAEKAKLVVGVLKKNGFDFSEADVLDVEKMKIEMQAAADRLASADFEASGQYHVRTNPDINLLVALDYLWEGKMRVAHNVYDSSHGMVDDDANNKGHRRGCVFKDSDGTFMIVVKMKGPWHEMTQKIDFGNN
jgi:hypothetical protein